MKTPILAIIFAIAGTMAAQAQTAPPCDFQFTSEDEFAKWTVIDGNPSDSPVVWEWSGDDASIDSSDEAADDWLISPAISLEAGETYAITFVVWSGFNNIHINSTLLSDKKPPLQDKLPSYRQKTISAAPMTPKFLPLSPRKKAASTILASTAQANVDITITYCACRACRSSGNQICPNTPRM